jgi:hypothetical protein
MVFVDTDDYPANRGDHVPCLNCGESWNAHHGWGCTHEYLNNKRSEIPADKQYLTTDMSTEQQIKARLKFAAGLSAIITQANPDVPEWKVWRDGNRLPTSVRVERNV